MSFRCCGCHAKYPNALWPEERRPTRIVVAAEARIYRHEFGVSQGWEILAEQNLCVGCANQVPDLTIRVPESVIQFRKEAA